MAEAPEIILGNENRVQDNEKETFSPTSSGQNSFSKHKNGHPSLQMWNKFLKFELANISGSITKGEINYPSAY